MITVKKVVLAGATVGAAALTTMSAAWACSAQAGAATLSTTSGGVGSTVRVEGRNFAIVPDQAPVQISWNSPRGVLLATVPGPTTEATTFSVDITIPAASPRIHFIMLVQWDAKGNVIGDATIPFEVLGAAPTPPPVTETQPAPPAQVPSVPPPTPDAAPTPSAGVVPPVADEPRPAVQPVTSGQPVPSPTVPPRAATPTPREAGAPASRPALSTAPAVDTATAPIPIQAGTQVAGTQVAEPQATTLQATFDEKDLPPSARDVWSGLDESSTFAPGASLTDPAPTPAADAPIMALAMVALGAIGLAAGAAPLVRRKRRIVPADRG